ncbi:hypothetical protein ACR9YC_07345 [Parasphingorhabdus sp. DH2-15]|uniref:hypothetical protein n=1 Tax=Parasphingorhabdus sp. DH2-15 TaxID=3444112 RepID=UPI003F6839E8
MGKYFVGGVASIILMLGGFLFFYSQAQEEQPVLAPEPPEPIAEAPLELPSADTEGLVGPAPPEATNLTKEQRRFGRYDRNFDKIITRMEMMASRTADFRKLDKDGNNLLTFEEWAVRTSDRFVKADADADGELTPEEFATTKPKARKKSKCAC